MLARLEQAYLSILRVVILIAATIALIVTVIGVIAGGAHIIGDSGNEESSVSSLGDFIAEQKKREAPSENATENADTPTASLSDIIDAAGNLHKYMGSRSEKTQVQWQAGLQQYADAAGEHDKDYAASVKDLTEELLVATGKPLSEMRIEQLLSWHFEHFRENVARKAEEEASKKAQFWVMAGAAGAAFLGFLMIIFIFIFVKIERNLRLVRITEAGEAPDGQSNA